MLEKRITETYGARSSAINKNSLHDSYIKAFRWSSDRLDPQSGGVVAFVSNAGWLDTNAMDGMRKCLAEEFSKIYVFNLRGNQRTSGELSRKEGGKIFGSGSRTPIAITILIKNPPQVQRSLARSLSAQRMQDLLPGSRRLSDQGAEAGRRRRAT
jgi:predicted helicase